jgi:hypothetical protein
MKLKKTEQECQARPFLARAPPLRYCQMTLGKSVALLTCASGTAVVSAAHERRRFCASTRQLASRRVFARPRHGPTLARG